MWPAILANVAYEATVDRDAFYRRPWNGNVDIVNGPRQNEPGLMTGPVGRRTQWVLRGVRGCVEYDLEEIRRIAGG